MKHRKLLFLLIFSLILHLVTLFYLVKIRPAGKPDTDYTQHPYRYLSPRVQSKLQNEIFLNFAPLRKILRSYIETQSFPIHLYFEYLPSGISIGINDNIDTPTASLIKVPTVIAVVNKIEKNQLSYDQMLTVTEKHIDKSFGTFWKQGVGATISLEDSINKTLTQSDNTTHNLLYNLLSKEERNDVFESLDINYESTDQGDRYYINPRTYTTILKSLYFSTYLNQESSEKILRMMIDAEDKSKLPAGISKDVQIAHKIGVNERTVGKFLYHDCGIVYYPKRPYAICVMTEGNEMQAVESIKTISKFIFDYMKSL